MHDVLGEGLVGQKNTAQPKDAILITLQKQTKGILPASGVEEDTNLVSGGVAHHLLLRLHTDE